MNITNINKKFDKLESEIKKINLTIPQNNWIKFINKNVQIRSKLGSKNLDINQGIMSNCTNIHLWENHGSFNQKFNIIVNIDGTVSFINGKYAIDYLLGHADYHTKIQIFERNGTEAQKFYIIYRGYGWYSIHSAINSNYCLDVNDGKSENGTNIQLYSFNDSDAQLFKFIE